MNNLKKQKLHDIMTVRLGGRPLEIENEDYFTIHSDDGRHFVTCEIQADNDTITAMLRNLDNKTFPERHKRCKKALTGPLEQVEGTV